MRLSNQEGAEMNNFLDKCGEAWCQLMHRGAMWPMHGVYRCRECMRVYDVPWTPKKAKCFVIDRKKGPLAA